MLPGKDLLLGTGFSDMRYQARHGPLEKSRPNFIVAGAATVAALGLPIKSLAYRLVCNFMFWMVEW